MFPKVFLLLLLSLFNFKFSSQTIIESKCNDKFEPTRYELHKHDGKVLLTAVVQMESTDAFEPILSLELIRFKPYDRKAVFQDKFSFKFREDLYYDEYAFKLQQYSYDKVACLSGFFEDETPSNASINKDTISCKWLINVGAYGVIKSFEGIEPSTYDMITKADTARIVLVSLDTSETVTKDLTDFPIYQWSYARYCEYNKKIYDIDGDMITLKKGNGAFELFVYSLTKYEPKRPRQITLINSKSHSISIFCDDDRNDIIVSTKIGSKESSVLDKYIFRKHIDALRCGISLSIEMGREHTSFSFDDAPLKLIYKTNDFDENIIQEVKFESDYIAMDEPTIETTSISSVNQHENVDENEKNDKVSPLIGVCLTIITVIKSYFDLW